MAFMVNGAPAEIVELVESSVDGFYICPLGGHIIPKSSMRKHLLTVHFDETKDYRLDGNRLYRVHEEPFKESSSSSSSSASQTPVMKMISEEEYIRMLAAQQEQIQQMRMKQPEVIHEPRETYSDAEDGADGMSPDRILEMVADQAAVKDLLVFLHNSSQEERNVLFDHVLPIIEDLLTTHSGTELMLAFVELARGRHRQSLLQQLEGKVSSHIRTPYGAALLERLVRQNVTLQDVSPSLVEEMISKDIHELASHRYASRVLLAIYENGADDQRVALQAELLDHAHRIMQSDKGAFLMQSLLSSRHVSEGDKQLIIRRLQGNIARMGTLRHSRSLVLTALATATPSELALMLEELAYHPVDKLPGIVYLAGDMSGFGWPVAEFAFKKASAAHLEIFAGVIASHWSSVEGSQELLTYMTAPENAHLASLISEGVLSASDERLTRGEAQDEEDRSDDETPVMVHPVESNSKKVIVSAQTVYIRPDDDSRLSEFDLQRKYPYLDVKARDDLARLADDDEDNWIVNEQDYRDLVVDKNDELNFNDKVSYSEYLESLGLLGSDETSIEWKVGDLCEARRDAKEESKWMLARINRINRERTKMIVQFTTRSDEAVTVDAENVRPVMRYQEVEQYRQSRPTAVNQYERNKLLRGRN